MAALPVSSAGAPPSLRPSNEALLVELLRELPARSISVAALQAAQELVGGACLLCGGMLTNTGANHDEITFYGQKGGQGQRIGILGILGAGGAVWGPDVEGILCVGGLSCIQAQGGITGNVWIKRQ